jgi:hypothetical protein
MSIKNQDITIWLLMIFICKVWQYQLIPLGVVYTVIFIGPLKSLTQVNEKSNCWNVLTRSNWSVKNKFKLLFHNSSKLESLTRKLPTRAKRRQVKLKLYACSSMQNSYKSQSSLSFFRSVNSHIEPLTY